MRVIFREWPRRCYRLRQWPWCARRWGRTTSCRGSATISLEIMAKMTPGKIQIIVSERNQEYWLMPRCERGARLKFFIKAIKSKLLLYHSEENVLDAETTFELSSAGEAVPFKSITIGIDLKSSHHKKLTSPLCRASPGQQCVSCGTAGALCTWKCTLFNVPLFVHSVQHHTWKCTLYTSPELEVYTMCSTVPGCVNSAHQHS